MLATCERTRLANRQAGCFQAKVTIGVARANGAASSTNAAAAASSSALRLTPTITWSSRSCRSCRSRNSSIRLHATSGDAAEGASAAAAAPAATAAAAQPPPLRVEIDTVGARQSIRLDVAPMGYGQAIVVVGVAGGSEAEEVGVRAGLRLTAISDPIRRSEVWRLQDRPSLKNVRELLKMRSADTIELEFVEWDGPLPGGGVEAGGGMMRTATSSSGSSAMSSTSGSVMASADGSDAAGGVPGESIGERLAREYAAAAATGRTPTAVEQRQKRRQERMELDAARDDRPFLLGVFALFVLPPLVILLVAWQSGYLDSLYLSTLTRQL